MGRLNGNCHKKTYTRLSTVNISQSNKKNAIKKQRKVLPNFEKLFIGKSEESFSDPFQNIILQSYLEATRSKLSNESNSWSKSPVFHRLNTFSHSNSGNDTFDKLTVGLSDMQINHVFDKKQAKNLIKSTKGNLHCKIYSNSDSSTHSPSSKGAASSLSSSSSKASETSGAHLFLSPVKLKNKPRRKEINLNPNTKLDESKIPKWSTNCKLNSNKKKTKCYRESTFTTNCLPIEPVPLCLPDQIGNDKNNVSTASSPDNDVKDMEQLNVNHDSLVLRTSTPSIPGSISCKYVTMRERAKLNPDLSPVERNDSFNNFEISGNTDFSSQFISCYSNISPMSIEKKIEQIEKFDEKSVLDNESIDLFQSQDIPTPKYKQRKSFCREMPKCFVLLERCDTNINNNASGLDGKVSNFSDASCISKTNSLLITSLRNEFNLAKRRNFVNNYTNKRRRKAYFKMQPSFISSSIFTKNSMSSFLSSNESKVIGSSNYVANLSVKIKCGKGWRRSIKESLKSRQSNEDSSSLEVSKCKLSSSNIFNRSSILLLANVPLTEHSVSQDYKQIILNLCKQSDIVPLIDCFNEEMISHCKKIGEGTFGEVFMSSYNKDSRVLKIMPIEGDFEVNGEPQKTFEEISSEVVVSMELSKLDDISKENSCCSYVTVYRSWCVYGSYTSKLLQLWDQFNKDKVSENDHPSIFPKEQLYIVLEFGYAGQDLESFVFNNALQAYAVFVQIALGLAVAEEELEFEHRDLHWGNILIAPITEASLNFKFNGNSYKIKTNGVKATIIDFTLSRMKCGNSVYFNDLSKDPSIFQAEGEYQFEIYRLMREANKDKWRDFVPVSNVYWLHYVVLKMIDDCYYKKTVTKIHKIGLRKLKDIEEDILQHTSAKSFALTLDELS